MSGKGLGSRGSGVVSGLSRKEQISRVGIISIVVPVIFEMVDCGGVRTVEAAFGSDVALEKIRAAKFEAAVGVLGSPEENLSLLTSLAAKNELLPVRSPSDWIVGWQLDSLGPARIFTIAASEGLGCRNDIEGNSSGTSASF